MLKMSLILVNTHLHRFSDNYAVILRHVLKYIGIDSRTCKLLRSVKLAPQLLDARLTAAPHFFHFKNVTAVL